MLPATSRGRNRSPRTVPGLRSELDRLFENFVEDPAAGFGSFAPATDLVETPEAVVAEMELPGFDRDDVEVTVERGTLTVSGRREAEADAEDESVHLRERSVGRFQRSFSLPASIRPEGVSARFADGVLRVEMPKREEAKTRRIEIDVT